MNKLEYTKSIIDTAVLSIDVDTAYNDWWFASTNSSLLRLTGKGYLALNKITPTYKFKSKLQSCGATYLKLSKLNCPYYVHFGSATSTIGQQLEVHIFGTKIATMIQLYGSIDDYLKTLK